MSELDLLLRRPIKDGKKYEALIPDSTCESTYLGKGMTDFSVNEMADWVMQYAWQMQKVAPLFSNKSLQLTCNAIHNFCFDHFQYMADLEDQYLRSPACSWHVRYEGIDCKSYSIIASCLLVNLGISHYIRRVRQPGFNPDTWSHVYVVVPADQKNFDLAKGYYVIDGTVRETDETLYVEKSDLFMSGMKHYGLAGAAPQGLNGLTLATVKNLFSTNISLKSLSCIGGSYTSADFDTTMSVLVPWFNAMFDQINTAVATNNANTMQLMNKLLSNASQIYNHAQNTASYKWNSDCSKQATAAYLALATYYYNIVYQAFIAWVTQSFAITYSSVTLQNGAFEPQIRVNNKGLDKTQFGRSFTANILGSLTLKPGTTTVYAFALTPYVSDSKSYSSFNAVTALQGMTTVLAAFGVGGGTTTTTTTTTTGQGGTTTSGTSPVVVDPVVPDNTKVDSAGLGAVGWVFLAMGGAMLARTMMGLPAIPGMDSKPEKKTAARKTRSKDKKSNH